MFNGLKQMLEMNLNEELKYIVLYYYYCIVLLYCIILTLYCVDNLRFISLTLEHDTRMVKKNVEESSQLQTACASSGYTKDITRFKTP